MNIVLWIGNEPNQIALANKIHSGFPVAAIVTETRNRKRKLTVSKIREKFLEKLFLSSIPAAWFGLQDYYRNYPALPAVPVLNVENINSPGAYDFTLDHKPDIIVVSGTRLIKDKMISVQPRIGILNLHTGLSPYIKGGPNCTNWCLATGEAHLIGNTIMWLDAGIDSGNIVTTELTPFTGSESLADIHLKVMEHAHDLYVRAIEFLVSGKTSNTPQQDIGTGKTYYNKNWGIRQKVNLVKNARRFNSTINSLIYKSKQAGVKTIPLK